MKPGPANARYLRQNEAPAGTRMLRCTSGRLLEARARRQPASVGEVSEDEVGSRMSEPEVKPQGGVPVGRAAGNSLVDGVVPPEVVTRREREPKPHVARERF